MFFKYLKVASLILVIKLANINIGHGNITTNGLLSRIPDHLQEVTKKQIFRRDEILSVMKHVCDWQLANLKDSTINRSDTDRKEFIRSNGWIRAAFYSGVMATYYATEEKKYLDSVMNWVKRNNYLPGPSPRHADDQAVAQVYAELFMLNKDTLLLKAIMKNYDLMISDPLRGPVAGWSKSQNWAWCDALFMAPPGMARVAHITGNSKYYDLLNVMWWDTYDYLYDKTEHLFYRDANYIQGLNGIQPRTPAGRKIFWARGNGWVMAGLARTLQYLPKDFPDRARYESLFREMAGEVIKYQGKDGMWRSGLNEPDWYPEKESSSTGMFCFSLAYGINNNLLNSNDYLPVVIKAWKGLTGCVENNGKLGYVQVTGHDPRKVYRFDNVEYGAGAFLLAGNEILKLPGLFK